MPLLSILNQAKGPLPVTAQFQSPSDGPATLMVTGSVWSGNTNVTIGIQVVLDGQVVGTASIFSNGASTHRSVVPSYIPVELSIGLHKLVLAPLNSVTVSDGNDYFDVALLY